MRQLTLREKIGQLIVAGFPGPEIDEETQRLLAEYKIGNIILFAHNVVNREQLKGLCAELQRSITEHTGHAALISIDQEGGGSRACRRMPSTCRGRWRSPRRAAPKTPMRQDG